jgi:hypothetical protein
MATSTNHRSAKLVIGAAFTAIVFVATRALQAQTEQTAILSLEQLTLLATQVNLVRAAKNGGLLPLIRSNRATYPRIPHSLI